MSSSLRFRVLIAACLWGVVQIAFQLQAQRAPEGPRGRLGGPGGFGGRDQRTTRVVLQRDSQYSVATNAATGRFRTGQSADLMLSGVGFNSTGGPLLFNHPSGLASDGTNLLLCDRFNNRVLIWTNAPASNTLPHLVLGQPDFVSNDPGRGRNQLNWPGNVAISPDGSKVAVADTENDRVLLWNSFPTQNGASADLAFELPRLNFSGRQRPSWPWGVWTDGKKLAAVATHGAAVLIWNAWPTRDQQAPDLVLTPPQSGTPRNITSDGTTFFALSDHNYGENRRPATMFWNTFPTAATEPPSFVQREWFKGCLLPSGNLIMGTINSVQLWDRVPRSATDEPSLVLHPPGYANGDGPDAVLANGRLYVCSYNGNKVLVWNRVPTQSGQAPDFALGSRNVNHNTLEDIGFISNPIPATDGNSLFVSSDFDARLYVWRHLPNESGAKPDVIYDLSGAPWDNALHVQTLVLAGGRSVMVWRKLPLQGELPDLVLRGQVGGVELRNVTGVALHEKLFCLADREADRVYVWEEIPSGATPPKFTLQVPRPGRLSSDGIWLTVAPFEGNEIKLFKTAEFASGQPAVRLGGPGKFNLPGKCLVTDGKMFVADTSFHRVHVWHRLEDALANQPADALLGVTRPQDLQPGIGRNELFMPAGLAWGAGYLWVGEFKFSSRVLRFSGTR